MFLKTNVVIKESPYSIKIKYILSTHFQDEHVFGIPQLLGSKNSNNVVQLNPD